MDGGIIEIARKRFEKVYNYMRDNHKEALNDLQMLAGEDHWPDKIRRQRIEENRPVITVNKLPSFTDRVTNEGRLNKIAIKVRPYGGGATEELADTYSGLIRNIENESDAESAYQTAFEGAVSNGFGYIGVITKYSDDSSFEQDIFIRRIKNPLSVYLDWHDPCMFGFVTEMISKEDYEARFPGVEPPSELPGDVSWVNEDEYRIAEYWTKEPTTKEIYLLNDGRTVDAEDWDEVGDPNMVIRKRTVKTHKITQYIIDGEKVLEKNDWAGKYIPIVEVPGKELMIDNRRVLRGVIRFAKDPQRMYNYFRTAATETVALAPKAPYIMEEEQIEGHEEEWGSLGKKNLPYLLYKRVAGVPAPQRQVVTQTAIGEITESNLANDEMKATTSMFDASLGAQGNEISGRAISARQSQGDIANFTYYDNLKRAVKQIGRILVDLIPKIYDTERQLIILNEDETETIITVNQRVGDKIINDLTQGKYKVVVSAGPSFSTQRVEAVQSMLDFVRVAPQTASMMADLIAENMDWPGAIRIARRLKKLLPPGIDDEGPMPPPQPSIDDIIKKLKAEGIAIGNEKRKLDVIDKRREMTNTLEDVARAGAIGALKTVLGDQGEEQ